MLRCAVVPLLLLVGVRGGAAPAGCGGGNETLAPSGLFWMGDHLEYAAVACTMGFVIVFTICCEYAVMRARKWTKHFNPLLHPCIDKVIAELMILGAMAFSILLVNELTGNSLSNGTVMSVDWYHTLHWIDTTIFLFAIIYVLAACYLLTLSEIGGRWLARLDAAKMRGGKRAGISVGKQFQYQLIKRHFLKAFFNDANMRFDFVFYIELCHIGGMTSSFEIGKGEWLLLFVACLFTTRDAIGMKVYQIYGFACMLLLVISVVVICVVWREFGRILTRNYDIADPNDEDQLKAAAAGQHVEQSKGKQRGYFHNYLSKPQNPKFNHPHNQSSTSRSHFSKPDSKKVYIWGLGCSERTLYMFVQRQLLVICFYMAMFLMSYINMFRSGKMHGAWFMLALTSLLANLLIAMPLVMFLGFSLAAVINADTHALKEIGRLRQEGETALVYLENIMVSELQKSADSDETQDQKIDAIFRHWAGNDDIITDSEIMTQICNYALEHGHSEFYIDRPKLLAMMRLVDDDRNGSINKQEFEVFILQCMEKEETENPAFDKLQHPALHLDHEDHEPIQLLAVAEAYFSAATAAAADKATTTTTTSGSTTLTTTSSNSSGDDPLGLGLPNGVRLSEDPTVGQAKQELAAMVSRQRELLEIIRREDVVERQINQLNAGYREFTRVMV